MKRRGISVRSLFIGFFTIVFFVCSVLSLGLMSKKMKTVSAATDKVEVYQLAPNNGYLMQSYVIKTANGKLVVIDGGTDGVFATDVNYPQYESGVALAAKAYLPAALRAIAGKTAAEEVEVDAWFLSHAHRDHFSELSKVLSDSESNVKINNFYFDFPDFGGDFPMVNSQQANLDALKEAFAGAGYDYDALNGAVVNADSVAKGLTITVDGVHFDVLQTWDMSDGYYDEVNDTSMVLRMRVGDNSVLFLNDVWLNGGRRLTEKYTAEQLASDYVQISHHGHAGVSKAQYDKMGITASTKLLWPTPCVTFNNATEFFVDETYEWFNETSYVVNGVVDATKVDKERNFFACLYDAYPTDMTSVDDWKTCVAGMMVASFEYVDTTFEVLGAAVRTADPDGIRFVAQLNTQTLSSYGSVKYGMMLVPEDMDNGADLTVTYDGATYTPSNQNAIVIEGGDFWSEDLRTANGIKEGYSAFSCALLADQGDGSSVVKFPEAFYNRPITAVAFVIKESGEVIYTEKVTRSISYVAAVESLKPTYEENEVVEKFVAGAVPTLTINEGMELNNLYKKYVPRLTVGGMTVTDAVNVTYSSDNEEAAKIVDGKVQPVANGVANVTATMKLDGEKTVTATTEVTVAVTKTPSSTVLNDCEWIGGWMQTDHTVNASAEHVKDGVQSAKVDFAGWGYFDIRIQNPCPTLEEIKIAYETITFNAYCENAPLEQVTLFRADQATVHTYLNNNADNFISINTSDMTATDYVDDGNGGRFLRFFVGGACTVYIDNVVGVGRVDISEKLATPEVEVWQDGTVVWSKVEGATAYAYIANGLTANVTNATSIKLSGNAIVRVKALGDGVYYKDGEYSKTIKYVQKDVLNGCEYALAGWAEPASGCTIEVSSEHISQGYNSLKVTTTGWAAFYLNMKKNYAPLSLSQLNEYDRFELTVTANVDTPFYFYAHNMGNLTANTTTTLSITREAFLAQIELAASRGAVAYDPATGKTHFEMPAGVTAYIDNFVGVKDGQYIAPSSALLNDCETVAGVDVPATITVEPSTSHVTSGNYSLKLQPAGWSYLNLYLGMDCATLKATYDTITFDVYSEEVMTLFRKDGATPAVSLQAGESKTATISTAGLTQDGDFTGNYLTLWAGGAGTVYIDNVVGQKAAKQSLGNVFILGDSYSTFEGWLPYDYAPWYLEEPCPDVGRETDVDDVTQTWWHQLLMATGSNLSQNCSYSGTTICHAPSGWAGTDETHRSFITRFIKAVEDGELKDVDTVFLFGGTNDSWLGTEVGTPKYEGWTDAELKQVYPGLCYLLNIMKIHAPHARIIMILNTEDLQAGGIDRASVFQEIATAYGIESISLSFVASDKSAGHPNQQGMTSIKNQILSYLNTH